MSLFFHANQRLDTPLRQELVETLEIKGRVTGFKGRTARNHSLPGTAIIPSIAGDIASENNSKKNEIKCGIIQWLLMTRSERHLFRALKYLNKGKNKKARSKLLHALELDEDFTDALFILALLTEDKEERFLAVNKALENRADYGDFFIKYGIWLQGMPNLIPDVKLRLTNDRSGFFLYLAEVLEANNEHKRAVRLLEESELLSRPEILLSLGELYYQIGSYDRTIRLLQEMENEGVTGTISLLLQGMAFREEGLTRAAVEKLRKARRKTRDCPESLILEARYQLGLTLEKEGKKYLARREYERILSVDFDYQDVREKLSGDKKLGNNYS